MYPIVFIMYLIFKNQYKNTDGSLFAVNMKPEWMKEPKVAAIVEKFRKEMRTYLILLLILPLTSFLVSYVSIQLTIWMIWVLLAIVWFCLPLIHANRALKTWKKEQKLYEEAKMEHHVELKLLGKIRRVKFLPFLIPNLLAGLLAFGSYVVRFLRPDIDKRVELGSVGWLCIVMWLCGLFLWAVAVWMDRQPITVISTDSDVNLNYTRAKKNIWKNFWLMINWCNTVFVVMNFFSALVMPYWGTAVLVESIAYAVFTAGMCFPLMKQLKKVENTYQDKHNLSDDYEDDRNWIGGLLYYNPADKHSMVQKKVGVGTTMNLATPVGKGYVIFSALALMIIPVTCIWVILLEFTPIQLEVENRTLYAKQLNVNYEIPVEHVENVKKITELPSWSKTSGTAMDTLEEGTFFIRNVGKCEVFLNPQNTEFLHFTADGVDYYMSGYDDAQTEEIYQLLTQH